MTDNALVNVPMIQVPVFGEDERLIPATQLLEGRQGDMATVSDEELIDLVVNFYDLAGIEALKRLIMGEHYSANRELKVSRPSTGHILIAPSVLLG